MAARGSYVVFFTARGAEGVPSVYGRYSLKSAKDYARISSQHGAPAEVWRGGYRTAGSKRVRRYEAGERAWPLRPRDLEGLRKAEVPRQMRRYGKALGIKNPQDTPTVQVWIIKRGPNSYEIGLVSKQKDLMYREMLIAAGRDAFEYPLLEADLHPELVASLTKKQLYRLETEGEIIVRVPVENVEEAIDSEWGTKLFKL